MIQRQHLQRSIFEAAIGSIEKLIDGLIEPALQRLDAVLADEQLLEAVLGRLAQRWSQSRTRGRPGTPAEVVLRMLVLKRIKGWSFEETEREVRSSLVYRYLVRVYFEPVPDAKTLIRLSKVIGVEGLEAIHGRLLEIAKDQGLIKGQRARVDTTVVETNISYPTDSNLLADGVAGVNAGAETNRADDRCGGAKGAQPQARHHPQGAGDCARGAQSQSEE